MIPPLLSNKKITKILGKSENEESESGEEIKMMINSSTTSPDITPLEDFKSVSEKQNKLLDSLKIIYDKHGSIDTFFVILYKLFYFDIVKLKNASDGRLRFIREIDFLKISNQLKNDPLQNVKKIEETYLKNEPKQEEIKKTEIIQLSQNENNKDIVFDSQIKVIKEDQMKIETESKVISIDNELKTKKIIHKKSIEIQNDEEKLESNQDSNSLLDSLKKKENFEEMPDNFLLEEFECFIFSIINIIKYSITNKQRITKITFDKDNSDHVKLVKSLTNFRCFVYRIQNVDSEELRKKIGNIVPAISHTNAIIAGLLFQNMQKVFLKEFLIKQVKPLGIDLSAKNIQKLSKNELLLCQIMKTREFALVNGEMQKLVNISSMKPNSKCKTCSIKREILEIPKLISIKKFKNQISKLLQIEEYSIFFKGELIIENFIGEESDEDFEENQTKVLDTKQKTEIMQKIQNDKPKTKNLWNIFEHIDKKTRIDLTNTNNHSKSDNNQDPSKDKIREIFIMNEDSIPLCIAFIIFTNKIQNVKLLPANENKDKYNFIQNELEIPHINNYMIQISNTKLNMTNVCSLESDSKIKLSAKKLDKRSESKSNNNEKIIIMNDKTSKRIKIK